MVDGPDFQIGDLVECVYDINISVGGPQKGEHFTVTIVENSFIGFKLLRLSRGYSNECREGLTTNWHSSGFKLIHRSEAGAILYGK